MRYHWITGGGRPLLGSFAPHPMTFIPETADLIDDLTAYIEANPDELAELEAALEALAD